MYVRKNRGWPFSHSKSTVFYFDLLSLWACFLWHLSLYVHLHGIFFSFVCRVDKLLSLNFSIRWTHFHGRQFISFRFYLPFISISWHTKKDLSNSIHWMYFKERIRKKEKTLDLKSLKNWMSTNEWDEMKVCHPLFLSLAQFQNRFPLISIRQIYTHTHTHELWKNEKKSFSNAKRTMRIKKSHTSRCWAIKINENCVTFLTRFFMKRKLTFAISEKKKFYFSMINRTSSPNCYVTTINVFYFLQYYDIDKYHQLISIKGGFVSI